MSKFTDWYEICGSKAVENFPSVHELYADISKPAFECALSLTSDNTKKFKKLYGKEDGYYRGSEFYFHAWKVMYRKTQFILLSAKGKGTCIEVINGNNKVVVEFLKHLYKKLKEET